MANVLLLQFSEKACVQLVLWEVPYKQTSKLQTFKDADMRSINVRHEWSPLSPLAAGPSVLPLLLAPCSLSMSLCPTPFLEPQKTVPACFSFPLGRWRILEFLPCPLGLPFPHTPPHSSASWALPRLLIFVVYSVTTHGRCFLYRLVLKVEDQ